MPKVLIETEVCIFIYVDDIGYIGPAAAVDSSFILGRPQLGNLYQIITSAMAKVMFSLLSVGLSVCLSVCRSACLPVCLSARLSVCLSVSVCPSVCLSVCLLATLRKNGWTDFHEIFRVSGTWYKEEMRIFSGCSIKPLENRRFFPFFRGIHALSSIAEKRWNGFSWNFQKRPDMTQGAIWNIFGMLRLTPWILGRFIYFLDPCLVVILWKNVWTDFHIFLGNVRLDRRNN